MLSSIVIVDDHLVVRRGLRNLLETDSQLQVVGEAGNGHDALALLENSQPQVIIVDITMPEMDGINLAKIVHERWPDIKSIILSVHADEEALQQALISGAQGYVLKRATMEEIIQAVYDVASDRYYLSQP